MAGREEVQSIPDTTKIEFSKRISNRTRYILVGLTWFFFNVVVVVSCIGAGCFSHSTASYAVLASIGTIVLCIPMCYLLFNVFDADFLIGLVAISCFLIISSLFGGFSGYTWDNYCIFLQEPIGEQPIGTATHSQRYIYRFYDNTQIVSSMTESYFYKSESWFAAPIVICDEGTSVSNGTCPSQNSRNVGVAVAVQYRYTPFSVPRPDWDTQAKSAARLKLLYPSYYESMSEFVKEKYSDRLDFVPDAPYVIVGDLDELESTWRKHAIGTFCGVFVTMLILPPVILLKIALK